MKALKESESEESPEPSDNELFIDDESDNDGNTDKLDADDMMLGEEGSGMDPPSKGTGAEDMESSGSGYGPDDEDAQVGGKNKGKAGVDSEEDEDDMDDGDDEDEDDNEDFDTEKSQKVFTPVTTASTTTTTVKSLDEESNFPEQPKQNNDDVNLAPSVPSVPEVPQTTSTSTLPPPPSNAIDEHSSSNGVYISPNSHPERTSSFFAQPGILAAVIGGAVVGLLCAILVVMFIVYRMRKKDEGSYPLEETKRSPATNPYLKSSHREFYA
ncbi:syndecan [Acyrthosiphon pisum]|uniref:Syndecan n=1 Tax=Acyrthosiphon pisum TaxID=7029 RepID=A0A8R2FAL5_ACYPI|nr:syndecan [Acyrthosiphon pisum]|eukprot:XP_008183893.1 PREDICTED: syndecan [Acyrthosiphon pisum]